MNGFTTATKTSDWTKTDYTVSFTPSFAFNPGSTFTTTTQSDTEIGFSIADVPGSGGLAFENANQV